MFSTMIYFRHFPYKSRMSVAATLAQTAALITHYQSRKSLDQEAYQIVSLTYINY
jgi:hypothetical protein